MLATALLAINGKTKADVLFWNIKCWGKQAELMAKYLKKGRQVGISGHFIQEKWEEGNSMRSKTFLVADRITFLDRTPEQLEEDRARAEQEQADKTQSQQTKRPLEEDEL